MPQNHFLHHRFTLTGAAGKALKSRLDALAKTSDGRVGIGVQLGPDTIAVNGDQRFSLQSVVKLLVAAAAMDAVDRRGWKLSDPVVVHKQDLSLNVQPISRLVHDDKGYATTIRDLIFRAIVDSDSAASDILFARVGGAAQINAFLRRSGIHGIRVDRDERHLQTETGGLTWRPEYVDASVLEAARKAVPEDARAAAFRAYLKDPRDTATPREMTRFLYALATGKVVSHASTHFLLDVMRQTTTSPDRLKAGIPAGWTLGHKTGTSGTWQGLNAASNDVGILTAPDGTMLAVSVFVAESRRSSELRSAVIAHVARAIVAAYR